MTARNFLVRGLLAGLIAGLLAFAVAYVVGEPHVDAAIAVEEANAAHEAEHAENPPADGHTHEHEDDEGTVVSRANQSTWGLATGTLAVGIALGGVTGLAAAFAVGRIGRLRPSQSTALVSLIGFVAVTLVPLLKYPATPPAVGNPDTIGDRTLEYFGLMGLSVLAAVGAVVLAAPRPRVVRHLPHGPARRRRRTSSSSSRPPSCCPPSTRWPTSRRTRSGTSGSPRC